jgi:hypothetical protein
MCGFGDPDWTLRQEDRLVAGAPSPRSGRQAPRAKVRLLEAIQLHSWRQPVSGSN